VTAADGARDHVRASRRDLSTPAERSLRARSAVLTSWARTADPSARTARGRAAANKRFEDEVDPGRVLPEAERRRRAEYARQAFMVDLSRRAVKARRERAATNATPEESGAVFSNGDESTDGLDAA
jgi:hypothetical protein